VKYLQGLGELSGVIDLWISGTPLAVSYMADISGEAVKEIVDKIYGDTTKLDSLAESTQDDREALGYAANEPLIRTGELLKDSVKVEHAGEGYVVVGSDEPIHAYHEYGYFNVRANRFVPPRPVFRIAAAESIPVIELIAEKSIKELLKA